MNEKDWMHAKTFLVEVVYQYHQFYTEENPTREEVAEHFERKSKAAHYERMQIGSFGLRVYPKPVLDDVVNKLYHLRREGFNVMDHGHVPRSPHLYFILTNESETKMPTETAFEPEFAEWLE